MKSLLLLVVFALLACEPPELPEPFKETEVDLSLLEDKYNSYLKEALSNTDGFGWLDTNCDGLLFNSLFALSGGSPDIYSAEKSPGKWHRRPSFDCWPDNSRSTISRDMILGLTLYLFVNKDLQSLENLWEYGESHKWSFGEGDKVAVFLPPSGRTYLASAIFSLGGKYRPIIAKSLRGYLFPCKTYGCHLNAVELLLYKHIEGGFRENGRRFLAKMVTKEPANAIYQALYSQAHGTTMKPAYDILMNEDLFPNESIPTVENYCTHYLFQREQFENEKLSKNWAPCPSGKEEHTGIDFLFAAALVLNKI